MNLGLLRAQYDLGQRWWPHLDNPTCQNGPGVQPLVLILTLLLELDQNEINCSCVPSCNGNQICPLWWSVGSRTQKGKGRALCPVQHQIQQPGDTHCVQNPCCCSAVETHVYWCVWLSQSAQYGWEEQTLTYRELSERRADEQTGRLWTVYLSDIDSIQT